MIGNLRETTERNAAAGLAQLEPRPLLRDAAGPARPEDRRAAAHERADAARRAPTTARSTSPRTRGEDEETELRLIATYGYKERKSIANRFKLGEALVGQAALERKPIVITQAPEDYIKIASGLGEAAPTSIIVIPVLFEESVMAVIELASFDAVHARSSRRSSTSSPSRSASS